MMWASNAENAFGAFIHICLQEGARKAFYKCGFMTCVSACVQLTFVYELWKGLPPGRVWGSGFRVGI